MDELRIKDAFVKVKEDISEIKEQLAIFSQELVELKGFLSTLHQENSDQQTDSQTDQPRVQQSSTQNPAHSQSSPAVQHPESSFPTHNLPLYALKSPNSNVSIGNRGVPTDRQTDSQTDQHIGNEGVSSYTNSIERVSQLINSLDTIKQEVRFKFKKLTPQEMLIFSTIYQLEEENRVITYFNVAKKLSLSESSIRDYTQKIIKKGIPLIKTKENNKKILLSVSPDLKKIASLSTILQLRDI